MLLIRKDRKIDAAERTMAVRIGKILSFEKNFCENVIEQIMDNTYIVDLPPRFSATEIAGCFIKDGLKLSFVDGHIHKNELIWLKAVAEINGLEDKWYDDSVKAAADQGSGDLEDILEAKYLEWESRRIFSDNFPGVMIIQF
jgi:hypothetical protein